MQLSCCSRPPARVRGRNATRGERLHEIWHGEPAPIEPLVPELEAVTPAERRGAIVAGYLWMLVGLLLTAGAGIAAVMFFTALSRWEFRGVIAIGDLGIGLIVHGASLLEAADQTAPLPDAKLRN
jgi:hypothetical protein